MTTTINGSSPSITFSDGSAQTSATRPFQNRIINGAMVIDQRNAGAQTTPSSSGYFSLDRYGIQNNTGGSRFTSQQNAGSVTPPVGFANYLGLTSTSAYSVASGDACGIYQNIEGFNTADLNWGTANAKTVTLSFWVRSSLTGTFGGSLLNSAGNRSYVFSYTINTANTFEYKTITVAGDTSGTWVGATNGTGIALNIGIGTGTTYSGTAGSWSGTYLLNVTGNTSVVGTNGATFYITGVQLEVGSTATSFDYRPYTTELQLCQRYFEKIGGDIAQDVYIDTYGVSGGECMYCVQYKVTKRANPTGAIFGTFTKSGNVGSLYFTPAGKNTCSVVGDVSSTARAFFYNPDTSTYLTLSAEL